MDKTDLKDMLSSFERDMITFAQELIRIKSLSGDESVIAHYIKRTMEALDYDEVTIDPMGNVIGRIGCGDTSILFDSHMDTVDAMDEAQWNFPPFSGAIHEGNLYGRGAADMKSALAASVYAGSLAKKMGWTTGKTVYVTCTVDEEYCDGLSLRYLLLEQCETRPHYVVICEPSDNRIAVGHKGKMQCVIQTDGVAGHGSAPEQGVNAVYKMAEIIQRVEALGYRLASQGEYRGSIVLSNISCMTASLNAIPSRCEIYLDRRTMPEETKEQLFAEMDGLVSGTGAVWRLGILDRVSWTGIPLQYLPFHSAWTIDTDHPLLQCAKTAYQETFSKEAQTLFWDFGTNAVAPVAMEIPTIGFGPGSPKQAHARDEHCPVKQITEACQFYANLIHAI